MLFTQDYLAVTGRMFSLVIVRLTAKILHPVCPVRDREDVAVEGVEVKEGEGEQPKPQHQ